MLENLNAILSRSQPSVKNFQCHDTRISIDSITFCWLFEIQLKLSCCMESQRFYGIWLEACFFPHNSWSILSKFHGELWALFFLLHFFPLAFFFRFLKLYEHPTGRLFDLNWFSINQKKKRKEKKKKRNAMRELCRGNGNLKAGKAKTVLRRQVELIYSIRVTGCNGRCSVSRGHFPSHSRWISFVISFGIPQVDFICNVSKFRSCSQFPLHSSRLNRWYHQLRLELIFGMMHYPPTWELP